MHWLTDLLPAAFGKVLLASLQAAVLVALVLLVQRLAGKRLPPAWRHGLWMLVMLRLALVWAPTSQVSLFNLVRLDGADWQPAPQSRPGNGASHQSEHHDLGLAQGSAPRLPGAVATKAPSNQTALPGTPFSPIPQNLRAGASPSQSPGSGGLGPSGWPKAVWTVLALAWAAVATALLLRTLGAAVFTCMALRKASPCRDRVVLELLDRCRREMKVRRRPVLLAAPSAAGPALAGVLRPRILMPARLLQALGAEEMRFVFLHELAHAKRLDLLFQSLARVLSALHWFNPAAWLTCRWMRNESELAADALVLSACSSQDGLRYGHTILKLVERLTGPEAVPGVLALAESGKQVQRRITMIASYRGRGRGGRLLGAAVAAALAAVALTNCSAQPGSTGQTAPALPVAPVRAGPTTAPASLLAASTAEQEAEQRIRLRLQTVLPKFRLENSPLSAAIDHLGEAAEVNTIVRWQALEPLAINKDSPVTVRLAQIPVEKALRTVLSQAGGVNPLGFAVIDGVLTISTQDDLSRQTFTRVYDVGDLLEYLREKAEKGEPALLMPTPVTPRPTAYGPVYAPVPPVPTPPMTPSRPPSVHAGRPADLAPQIVNMIITSVARETWSENGGSLGSIQVLGQFLVVRQSQENLWRVEDLLGQFHQSQMLKWRQELMARLQKVLPKVDMRNVAFVDAVDYVRQLTGVNIVLSPLVEKVNPPLTITAEKLTGEQVLRLAVRMADLDWRLTDGAIYIEPK